MPVFDTDSSHRPCVWGREDREAPGAVRPRHHAV